MTEVTGLYDSKSCQGEDYKFSLIIHNIPSVFLLKLVFRIKIIDRLIFIDMIFDSQLIYEFILAMHSTHEFLPIYDRLCYKIYAVLRYTAFIAEFMAIAR